MENFALLILISYLIGAVPTGWLLVKIFTGHDIRNHGSKSIGFTNVSRVINLRLGLITLIIDIGKAFAAVYWLAPYLGGPESIYQAVAGVFCIIGNVFTFWFQNFKGGKAVATACGIFLALMPLVSLIALSCWLIVLLISRYVSLASLTAAVLLFPIYLANIIISGDNLLSFANWPKGVIVLAVATIIIFAHRNNIERLKNHQEKPITFKKAAR